MFLKLIILFLFAIFSVANRKFLIPYVVLNMFLWLNTSLELHIEFGSQFITPVTTYVYLMP